jgi:tetratricopeptide (TPR) repeat protein
MRTEVRYQRSDIRLLLVLLLLLLLNGTASAQSILLKSGQRVDTLGVRRDGEMVMGRVQVGSGSGEVGYHSAQIAKIEFPEPRGLKTAAEILNQGQLEKAMAEIEPVVRYYEPFREIPGAWWAQAALIKVSLLGALRRETEAESLAGEIQKSVADPETARAAQLRLVSGFVRKKDFEKALAIADAAIKESSDSTTLARAWLAKGDVAAAKKEWDTALLAYLRVPIFYQDEKPLMPAALLGSARAYRRLDDEERAKKSLNELVATFPKSAEAAAAQSELQKMAK